MSDGLIHIPAKRRRASSDQTVIRISKEAYDVLEEICDESGFPVKHIASLLIIEAGKRVVYDREG